MTTMRRWPLPLPFPPSRSQSGKYNCNTLRQAVTLGEDVQGSSGTLYRVFDCERSATTFAAAATAKQPRRRSRGRPGGAPGSPTIEKGKPASAAVAKIARPAANILLRTDVSPSTPPTDRNAKKSRGKASLGKVSAGMLDFGVILIISLTFLGSMSPCTHRVLCSTLCPSLRLPGSPAPRLPGSPPPAHTACFYFVPTNSHACRMRSHADWCLPSDAIPDSRKKNLKKRLQVRPARSSPSAEPEPGPNWAMMLMMMHGAPRSQRPRAKCPPISRAMTSSRSASRRAAPVHLRPAKQPGSFQWTK